MFRKLSAFAWEKKNAYSGILPIQDAYQCTLYDITNNRIWKLYNYLALNTLNSVIEDFESPINEINKKIIDCKGSNQI